MPAMAFAQGYSVRSYQGKSTNESHYGTLSLYNGSGVSIGGIGPSEFAGHGGSLTNVPSKFFASIAAMTNSTPTSNLVVYVDSYWGTNFLWGGGAFKWENSSAAVDYGNVFYGVTGRWRRINERYPTNVILVENYGAIPNTGGDIASNLKDQSASVQAAINATPTTGGACIVQPFFATLTNSLIFTNWRGSYFGSLNPNIASGYNYYPYVTAGYSWNGPTNLAMLKIHNSGHNTFRGFGLDTLPPTTNPAYWTNHATLMVDVDLITPNITTTTENHFRSILFRERGTNSSLVGVRIAYVGADNCEFFTFENCYWQGSGGNIPDYWVNTTNLGGAKAIQLGGGGGGGDAFGHSMNHCGFNTWQYFVYSDGGSWNIENAHGTAAGEAAFYINGVKGSSIRFVEDEGDRRFLQSPSVHPVILEANRIAFAATSVSNIAQVDGVNLVLVGNVWNTDSSNLMPAVTNSFNNTGRYFGRNNTMPQTNTTAIASWRFASSFDSAGDFGTISDNNRIESFPARTVSLLGQTNPVWAAWTDSATFPALTLMPSNGAVAINGYINNSIFSVWNADPLNKTSLQIGDSLKNPRVRVLPTANTTTLEVSANQGAYVKVQSSNVVANVVAGNGVTTIDFQSGYGRITTSNSVVVTQFDNDGQVKFPNDTNIIFTGRVLLSRIISTNGYQSLATNYIANVGSATGFTNSTAAPGYGGTNAMYARVTATSGTLEYYHRSGANGATVGGIGVYTNTLTATPIVLPVGVNCGFIIRSGVGVDIQTFAQ